MTQATMTFEVNRSVLKEDAPRLSRQCALIIEMLTLRPHTNDELSRVSRKYTSRISDLRANGYAIECTRLGDGLASYRLEERFIDRFEGREDFGRSPQDVEP